MNTAEARLALQVLQRTIIENLTPITMAAINSAIGERFIYRIDKNENGTWGDPVLLEKPHEIAFALKNLKEEKWDSDSVYYIQTKPANTVALKELLERAFGKTPQPIDASVDVTFSLADIAKKALSRNEQTRIPQGNIHDVGIKEKDKHASTVNFERHIMVK